MVKKNLTNANLRLDEGEIKEKKRTNETKDMYKYEEEKQKRSFLFTIDILIVQSKYYLALSLNCVNNIIFIIDFSYLIDKSKIALLML